MTVLEIRDRGRIEAYLRGDPTLHLYELGDLDPFFWPRTRWLATAGPGDALAALALLYAGPDATTILALRRGDPAPLHGLLREAAEAGLLPARCYAHLTPGLSTALSPRFAVEPPRPSLKMALAHPERLAGIPGDDVRPLTPEDGPALARFYEAAYPDNGFDARMVETGQYVGVWDGAGLACVAGVHVYSPRYRVAALGNIATHPEARRQGLARRATAALCRGLARHVDSIGLNVYADNGAAIRMYRGLGFEDVTPYEERWLTARE